jgi:hypothetical protein
MRAGIVEPRRGIARIDKAVKPPTSEGPTLCHDLADQQRNTKGENSSGRGNLGRASHFSGEATNPIAILLQRCLARIWPSLSA